MGGRECLAENDGNSKVKKYEDPEVRKQAQIYTIVAGMRDSLESFIFHYSTWRKLKGAVAWWLCYKRFLKMKARLSKKNMLLARLSDRHQEKLRLSDSSRTSGS